MPRSNSNQSMIIDELRIIQTDLKDLSGVKETLERIEKQVIRTNGRVSALESWRNRIVGAVTVIGALLGYIVTFLKG